MIRTKTEIIIDNYFDNDCKDLLFSQIVKEAYSRGFKRAVEKFRPYEANWMINTIVNDTAYCYCSHCQATDIHAVGTEVPYCWNCGSKMRQISYEGDCGGDEDE